ncbi:zinc finger protein 23-like [Hyposmocoma kahamanoa]|uniref:zinc finger protein 23-like n=1 Tax=Hyposmocoma kahamanoa TaxID=1477025 RepID=UPI000E6D8A5D|nr:zinc finger protein 23-like [Hyposmocoma kahamanoa]
MVELCTSCLCSDRNLYILEETEFYHIYTQILNEASVYDVSQFCVRICWECHALLRRFQRFKLHAQHCYHVLLQHVQQNTTPVPNPPHLVTCHLDPFSCPQYIKHELDEHLDEQLGQNLEQPLGQHLHLDLATDVDSVKVEEHCEPETFVKEISVLRRKKREIKNKAPKGKIKKPKTKSTVKLKKKSKKSLSDDSDNNYSDNNLALEYDINEKVKTPDTADEIKFEIDVTDVEFIKPSKNLNNRSANLKNQSKTLRSLSKAVKNRSEVKVQTESSKETEKSDIGDKKNFKCAKCDSRFSVKSDLETHVMAQHAKVPPPPAKNKEVLDEKPQCGECGKIFSSKKTYRYHLNVLHKGQNRYPCPRCGKVYQWKSNLGRHMRSHKALDSGELYCEQCDKRFASVATYRQHLRISRRHVSESEFSFMCNECGKKFVNKTRLRDHIDWEHLNNIKFRCQLCNKPFKCHTSLYVHLQNVHRNKEKKDNLCHVCGKSYQNAAKLKYHIVAMHTQDTPYRCAHCSAAFGWYSSLYRHVREVHYKMKVQPKKTKKAKKLDLPSNAIMPQHMPMPQPHQP